ncbi:MAG TPA: Uma2 family endonuclease [Gemmataceae bacterium]|nr:Uma2 family endonuclease [Gemmataceae bacterium]
MSQAPSKRELAADEPEPTWGIAQLFPSQGQWSEEEYLALDTNHLVEFSNGFLEFPSMPTTMHQMITAYLYGVLLAFSTPHDLGTVLFAALRVRLWPRKYREPDVVFIRKEHRPRMGNRFWDGADLVMEVVSEGAEDRHRDLVEKREEYAQAGIPEYWIVDPQEERITVLRLGRKRYAVHGEFNKGATASSHLLPGFTVDVSAALSGEVPPMSPPKSRRKPKGRA